MRLSVIICFGLIIAVALPRAAAFDFLKSLFGGKSIFDFDQYNTDNDDTRSTDEFSTEDDDDDDDTYSSDTDDVSSVSHGHSHGGDSDDTDELTSSEERRRERYNRRNRYNRRRGNERERYRRFGRSRYRGLYGRYEGRIESTRNEDIFDGLSGSHQTGESCLSEAKFRNNRRRRIEYSVRDVRRILRRCDRQINHLSVDDVETRYGRYPGGCVYREHDRKINHWVHDPNAFLNRGLRSAKDRRRKRNRRISRYPCGRRNIKRNQIDVAFEKEYCRRVYDLVKRSNCDYCKLKVVMDRKSRLARCAKRELRNSNSPALVYHRTYTCLRDLAERQRRC